MIPICILMMEDESDRAFMSDLFAQYQRMMVSEIRKIVKDQWTAEDLMQETLEKLIPKVKELRVKESKRLMNYLITCCRNHALTYLAQQKRRLQVPLEEWDMEDLTQDQQAVEYRLIREEDSAALNRAWLRLDERSRWVLGGRYFEEKQPAEIARDLGIKPGSFRMALCRARRNLNALLEEERAAEEEKK